MTYRRWRGGRSAGVIATAPLDPAPTFLLPFADFGTGEMQSAFWRAGPVVFLSSGSVVLRDLLRELALPAGNAWTMAVCEAVKTAAIARGLPPPSSPVRAGAALPREYLGLALQVAYSAGPVGTAAYELPRTVRLPVLGAALPSVAAGDVTLRTTMDTSRLATDPFRVARAGVENTGGGSSGSSGSSMKWLLAAAAAFLLLRGGRSDG